VALDWGLPCSLRPLRHHSQSEQRVALDWGFPHSLRPLCHHSQSEQRLALDWGFQPMLSCLFQLMNRCWFRPMFLSEGQRVRRRVCLLVHRGGFIRGFVHGLVCWFVGGFADVSLVGPHAGCGPHGCGSCVPPCACADVAAYEPEDGTVGWMAPT
jgi:hypothetical protein